MKILRFNKKMCFYGVLVITGCILWWSLIPSMIQAGTTEIRYMTFIDPKKEGPRQEALRQNIESFEKKYPEYKVIVEVVPWAEIDKILISAIASGKGPDVVRISSLVLGQHIPAETIIPLDRFFAKWTQEERNDFITPWDFTVWDGKKMAFFLENRTVPLYYRQDYLEKAGLDKPPRTLEELVKFSAAVKKALPNVAPFAVGLSEKRRSATLMEAIPPLVWSAGGEIIDGQGKAIYNSPAGVRAFQFIRDLVKKHEVMPRSVVAYTYDDIHSGLRSGTIAMAVLGSHRYVAIRSGMKPEDQKYFKTSLFPGFGGPSPALVFGWVLTITKVSKNPEGAWKFLEHLISPEAQVRNARIGGELPSRRSTYKDPWFETEEAVHMKIWKDYLNEYGKVFKYPEKYTQMAEGWAEAAQKAILMDVDVKQALDEAAGKYNKLLEKP